jgi:N-acetylmuramoyl-L-alanine amidase
MTKDDLWTMAQTIYGEARGEGHAGLLAVAWVILNRARHSRKSPADICREPRQFSCWNEDDLNYPLISGATLETPGFASCLSMTLQVLTGILADPTKGSRHYCTIASEPTWAEGHEPCYVLGHHKFFNDIA